MRDVLRAVRGERLPPAVRRLLRWSSIRWAIRICGAVLALVIVGELAVSSASGGREPAAGAPPTRLQLDTAIAGAEHYLDGLYRDLPDGRAVVSEYYGLPVRVRFPALGVWMRPGDPGLSILSGEQSRLRESYIFEYEAAGLSEPVRLLVVVRWSSPAGTASIMASQVGGDAVEPMDVWLGDRQLAGWGSQEALREATTRIGPADYAGLKSLRYTVRHVTLMSVSEYRYRGETERSDRLAAVVDDTGYDVDADVYSPVWGLGLDQPDDYMFATEVYRDCTDPAVTEAMPDSPTYYPYQSKVCTIPTWGYVAMSREDPLVPLAQALHILEKHGDPDRSYSDGEHLRVTAVGLAGELEKRFRDQGGIPECLPGSCDSASTSTLRTVLFGMLETDLGFRRGDETSRTYADAVAASVLDDQVGPDGLIPTTTLGTLYRPDQVGGFYTHVSGDESGEPSSFTRRQMSSLAAALDIRPEYAGEIATNAETTLATYAFLVRYRCARYGTGCATWPGRAGITAR